MLLQTLNSHEWRQPTIRKGCSHDMPCRFCNWSGLGKYSDFMRNLYISITKKSYFVIKNSKQ